MSNAICKLSPQQLTDLLTYLQILFQHSQRDPVPTCCSCHTTPLLLLVQACWSGHSVFLNFRVCPATFSHPTHGLQPQLSSRASKKQWQHCFYLCVGVLLGVSSCPVPVLASYHLIKRWNLYSLFLLLEEMSHVIPVILVFTPKILRQFWLLVFLPEKISLCILTSARFTALGLQIEQFLF